MNEEQQEEKKGAAPASDAAGDGQPGTESAANLGGGAAPASDGAPPAGAKEEPEAPEENAKGDESRDKKVARLKAQIEELKSANADLKDQLLRRAADFDNYRKRSIQEKQEAIDYANTALLKDLLDVIDNFDRAVEAASKATDPKAIADGVTMVSKSFVNMLETKYKLVSYGAVGDAFNPDIHQAIGSAEDNVKAPVLKAVYLKGYKLRDRVIRHAKVMVSMPKAKGNDKAKAAEAKAEDAPGEGNKE